MDPSTGLLLIDWNECCETRRGRVRRVRLRDRWTRLRRDRWPTVRGELLAVLGDDRERSDRSDRGAVPAVSRPRGLVLAVVLATAPAACASSGDERPETPAKPAQGSPAAPTRASPSPATEPDESDPVEEAAERSGFHGKVDELPAALAAEMRGTTWETRMPGAHRRPADPPLQLSGVRRRGAARPDGRERRGRGRRALGVRAAVRRPVSHQTGRARDRVPPGSVRAASADHQPSERHGFVQLPSSGDPARPGRRLLSACVRSRGRRQPASEPVRDHRRLRAQPSGRALHGPEPFPRADRPQG